MEFVAYISTRYPSSAVVARVFSDEHFPCHRDETIEEVLTYVETNYKQELVDDIYSLLEEFEKSVFCEETYESYETSDAGSLGGLSYSDYEEEGGFAHKVGI